MLASAVLYNSYSTTDVSTLYKNVSSTTLQVPGVFLAFTTRTGNWRGLIYSLQLQLLTQKNVDLKVINIVKCTFMFVWVDERV